MKAEGIIICIVASALTWWLFGIFGLILGAVVAVCVITLAEHKPEQHKMRARMYDEWECEHCHNVNPSTAKKCLACNESMFDIREAKIVDVENN